MPSINTPNGKIKYRTVPLYLGVKQIDKKIARENLILLKKVLDAHSIHFQLHAGTLLGAMREHDFIDHDEDIDLALLDKYRNDILRIIPELEKIGFKICRYDKRDLLSIMRKGEYIDFYFYKEFNDKLLSCSGWLVLKEHIQNSTIVDFLGDTYEIPEKWEEYLVSEYSASWKIPLKTNNYDIPKYKRLIFAFKEHLKDFLPKPIFKYLALRAETKLRTRSLARLRKNLDIEI